MTNDAIEYVNRTMGPLEVLRKLIALARVDNLGLRSRMTEVLLSDMMEDAVVKPTGTNALMEGKVSRDERQANERLNR